MRDLNLLEFTNQFQLFVPMDNEEAISPELQELERTIDQTLLDTTTPPRATPTSLQSDLDLEAERVTVPVFDTATFPPLTPVSIPSKTVTWPRSQPTPKPAKPTMPLACLLLKPTSSNTLLERILSPPTLKRSKLSRSQLN